RRAGRERPLPRRLGGAGRARTPRLGRHRQRPGRDGRRAALRRARAGGVAGHAHRRPGRAGRGLRGGRPPRGRPAGGGQPGRRCLPARARRARGGVRRARRRGLRARGRGAARARAGAAPRGAAARVPPHARRPPPRRPSRGARACSRRPRRAGRARRLRPLPAMTLPLATAALLASLGVLVALLAPQAPRLLRHGGLPARPRRGWWALLLACEIGTAGAATAAAWLALAQRGRQLLARVRALGLRPVRAVMTPRVRIAALPVDIGGAALLAALREQRFSRVPVYRGERDNVVGVLYAKDLLGRDVSAPGFRLEPFLRPPAFVPLG